MGHKRRQDPAPANDLAHEVVATAAVIQEPAFAALWATIPPSQWPLRDTFVNFFVAGYLTATKRKESTE
jgi:hypothetical protein